MKLRLEHERNFTPAIRAGIYFLTFKGDVVRIGTSDNIFKSVCALQEKKLEPFDSFSYVISNHPEREFLYDEFKNLYFPNE